MSAWARPLQVDTVVPMTLESEPGAQVTEFACERCGEPVQRVTGFIHQNGDAHAIYFASCYHHVAHEAFIDVVFSPTWDNNADDHVSFGCRVGPMDGRSGPQSSLTTGGTAFEQSRMFGQKLTREDALTHPQLPEFWAVVDHVLTHDQVVRTHVYGRDAVLDSD